MSLDPRSEEHLLGVRPELVRVIREAATRATFRVTEGLRTPERQKMLVAQRKSKTLNSRHISGHAIDFIAIGSDGIATYDIKEMARVADVIKAVAIEQGVKIAWGGDWKGAWDSPHIELDRKKYPAKVVGVGTKIVEAVRDHPKTAVTGVVGGVELVKQTAEPVADAVTTTAEKVSGFQFPDLSQFQLVRDFALVLTDLLTWFSDNIILAAVCGVVAGVFTFLPQITERLPAWLRSSPSS